MVRMHPCDKNLYVRSRGLVAVIAAMLLIAGCADEPAATRGTAGASASQTGRAAGATITPAPAVEGRAAPPTTVTAVATEEPSWVLAGAGDIATCNGDGDSATAALLNVIAGTIFTAGDNAYENGSASEFARCYEPAWGRFRERTRPAAGNHEYGTTGATGYFSYFGTAAGEPGRGYYSYDLGPWHVIVVNSNCSAIGGCGVGSAQERWVRDDLAAHPARCTLAYWHHPRFSSGSHGSDVAMGPIWQALYDAGAELVVSGHDHDYERFAPQNAAGQADPERGVRQFVVGTGGRSHYAFPRGPIANSEARDAASFGVLKLTLYSGRYMWEFIPAAGAYFTDAGAGVCH